MKTTILSHEMLVELQQQFDRENAKLNALLSDADALLSKHPDIKSLVKFDNHGKGGPSLLYLNHDDGWDIVRDFPEPQTVYSVVISNGFYNYRDLAIAIAHRLDVSLADADLLIRALAVSTMKLPDDIIQLMTAGCIPQREGLSLCLNDEIVVLRECLEFIDNRPIDFLDAMRAQHGFFH